MAVKYCPSCQTLLLTLGNSKHTYLCFACHICWQIVDVDRVAHQPGAPTPFDAPLFDDLTEEEHKLLYGPDDEGGGN